MSEFADFRKWIGAAYEEKVPRAFDVIVREEIAVPEASTRDALWNILQRSIASAYPDSTAIEKEIQNQQFVSD